MKPVFVRYNIYTLYIYAVKYGNKNTSGRIFISMGHPEINIIPMLLLFFVGSAAWNAFSNMSKI